MAECHIFYIYKGHFISTQDINQYCLDSSCKHNFSQICKSRPLSEKRRALFSFVPLDHSSFLFNTQSLNAEVSGWYQNSKHWH